MITPARVPGPMATPAPATDERAARAAAMAHLRRDLPREYRRVGLVFAAPIILAVLLFTELVAPDVWLALIVASAYAGAWLL